MSDSNGTKPTTRRAVLQAAVGLSALPLTTLFAGRAAAQSRPATKVNDFMTTADVAKAEQEGEFLFYTHDSEPAAAGLCEAFGKDFPKIKGKYLRAQNGALFTKILAERQAGRFVVDVIQFSEPATALDFQKRGGYMKHVSAQNEFYAPEHLSNPVGDFFCSGVTFAGICYNTDKVKPEEAPKTWKDLTNPRWANAMSFKQSTSGLQFVQWYELKKLYGDQYWKDIAKLKPRGFDSRAQLFDRLAKGDDKICGLAELAGYLLGKEKGAHIAFVMPPDGLPAGTLWNGVVDKAPHPEAAKLFVDWLMSPRGQNHQQTNQYLYYGSVRKDAGPMPGGARLRDFKLLAPTAAEMPQYMAQQETFTKEWNAMLGL